jgi:hypothetical protein
MQNNRKQTQDQLIKKDKNYDECDSQSQVQYEVPNTIAPICLNQFGVTSFTSLLMVSPFGLTTLIHFLIKLIYFHMYI